MYVLYTKPDIISEPELFLSTATTSTTPQGLIGILFASGGNFLLPILLSTAQLAVSRQWPDSNIPQNLEQVKVIVNVAGAAATSLVAALNRWRQMRVKLPVAVAGTGVEATAALARRVFAVGATETTALLGGQSPPPHLKGKERRAEEGNAWDLMLS
jgi:hypothetical protein